MGLNGDISFIDGTLREGDQAPGVWFTPGDKAEIFHALDAAGVEVVDAGMPAISEEERALLRALSRLPERRAKVAASVRCRVEEVELAAACQVDAVFLIFPVSALHRQRLGVNAAEWRGMGLASLGAARRLGLTPFLVLEDASRADEASLAAAAEVAREGGAQHVVACDTVGVLTPARARALTATLRRLSPEAELGVHFHDDFGMATANTLEALEAGARWAAVTVNGIGERAGNAVLAEVAAAGALLLDRAVGVDLTAMGRLSALVEQRSGVIRSAHAPVVGERTFDHESGIHVDGLIKDRRSYEPVDPAQVGQGRRFVVGKHTGRAGLKAFAQESGLHADDACLERALRAIKGERPRALTEALADPAAARLLWELERRDLMADAAYDALLAAGARKTRRRSA